MKTVTSAIILIFVFPFFCCTGHSSGKIIQEELNDADTTLAASIKYTPEGYIQLKSNIIQSKSDFKKEYALNQEKGIENLRTNLFSTINDSIFPYWYGTPWDFNGTTQVPNQGNIACGYFVTTVIRDAGFDIQRVHLAQQAASVIINSLCDSATIRYCKNLDALKSYIGQFQNNSIFILGLSIHVGFIVKENDKLYFVHANYWDKAVVQRQLLEEAEPVLSSRVFMVGDFLSNNDMLLNWLGD